MKNHKILIIAILLIVTVIFAGCTGSEKLTTPAGNTPQITQTTTEATATPVETPSSQTDGELKPSDQVNATEVVGNDFSWYEYRINRSSEMPPNGIVSGISTDKTERSMSEFNGTPAIHIKSSYHAEYGYTRVADYYYDISMNNFFGGEFTSTRKGEKPYTEELSSDMNANLDMSGFFKKDALLTYQGTEPVTVPTGTYPDAKKYTIYNSESNITYSYSYWFATDVPVPILIQFPNRFLVGYNGFESRELTGWG